MKMERVAEVVRGWPYDGALNRAEVITTGATLVNGDLVMKQTDGTVSKPAGLITAAAGKIGMVMVGNGDAASALNSNKAEVLWSNYIVRISSYNAGSYAPGTALTVNAGKFSVATPATQSGVTPFAVVAGDPIVGYVLEAVSVSATETAHLTIVVG